jgi:hypothetical protein
VILWPGGGDWSRAPEHLRAIDLFNHGYFWEAHEAWEALWHLAPRGSPERIALKALIQSAAALLKRDLGHLAAAGRLFRSSLLGLEAVVSHSLVRGGPCLALDLSDFAQRLDAHWTAPDRETFPYLRLAGQPS